MRTKYRELILQHSVPLKPIPTLQEPVLKPLAGVRAVMFDIYGTLLISDCGDIGSSQAKPRRAKFVEALLEVGIRTIDNGDRGVRMLINEISADHQQARDLGVEYPEVDIVDVWRRTMQNLTEINLVKLSANDLPTLDYRKIALAYELRINPVWPMPGARECLGDLSQMDIRLGIISNAQFLTIELWQTLLQTGSENVLFDDALQFYSFQHQRAKPGLDLYEMAATKLAERKIETDEVLYVGNDMLNDILPAQAVGFRTALFAGDARSLRRREDDPRVVGVSPDIVVTDLLDIKNCIR